MKVTGFFVKICYDMGHETCFVRQVLLCKNFDRRIVMWPQIRYVCIAKERVPCFYEIGFDSQLPAIVIRLHQSLPLWLPPLDHSPFVKELLSDFKFNKCLTNFTRDDFGFEGVFKRQEVVDQYIVYHFHIPEFEKPLLEHCPACQDDGKNLFGRCEECSGKGYIQKGTFENWHEMYAASATFNLFFQLMYLGLMENKLVNSAKSQLIHLLALTRRDLRGFNLKGSLSISLVNFLTKFYRGMQLVAMIEAMETTWCKMFGSLVYWKGIINAVVENKCGFLYINCPGDGSHLYSISDDYQEGQGYSFASHNIDNPMQQITLLAGLAALCDTARQAQIT